MCRHPELLELRQVVGYLAGLGLDFHEDLLDLVCIGDGDDEPDVEVGMLPSVVVGLLGPGVDRVDDLVVAIVRCVNRHERRRPADLVGVHERSEP
jgi:hypothetical protein